MLSTASSACSTRRLVSAEASTQSEQEEALRRRVAELESALTSATDSLSKTAATLVKVTAERDKLRHAYELVKGQLELLRRRIFLAQAERIDTQQLELEFAETKTRLDKLANELGAAAAVPDASAAPPDPKRRGKETKPPGRRDLAAEDMPEERVEITDPALEGSAERIGFEVSYKLGRRRGGPVRIAMARVKYKVTSAGEADAFVTAALPKEIMDGGLLAPSLIAHLLTKKFRFGMPFTRLVEELASEGLRLDDSTMCRYAEHVGATLGCIVDACAKEAKDTAFCLSTDATGIAIQPPRHPTGKRQACLKGHLCVVLADRDHVFFEYQPKHTSEAVCAMFKAFKGYVQADAHCVYDALFRGDARVDEADKPPDEVACWSHARRKFWEAAVTTMRRAKRCSASTRFSSSKSAGATSPRSSGTSVVSSRRGPCSTTSSPGPRVCSSARATSAGPSPLRSATPSASATRFAVSSMTVGSALKTTPPNARSASSRSAGRRGCSAAPTCTLKPQRISSRSSLRASCTESISRPISPTSSASFHTGRETATSSSRPGTGLGRASGSTRSNSRSPSDT